MSMILNPYRYAGADFSPSDISGLTAWFDATTGLYDATTGGSEVTTDGASIARWEDQSGNGNHVTQATASLQPVLKTNQQNGLNIVRSNQDYLVSSTSFPIAGSSNRSIFTVFKRNDANYRMIVSFGTISYTGALCAVTSEYYLRFQITTKGYTDQGSNGSWTLLSVIGNGSTLDDYDSYFDGGTIATPTAENNTSQTLNTGSGPLYIFAGSFGQENIGDLAEVLIYDSALSDADRESVRDYLNNKWAVY